MLRISKCVMEIQKTLHFKSLMLVILALTVFKKCALTSPFFMISSAFVTSSKS